MKLKIPGSYDPVLSIREVEKAVKLVKDTFEKELADALSLERISAPLFVTANSGLNDDLSGVERAVSFDLRETGEIVQIVHSLAKWKRLVLSKYGFEPGCGIYTDMNAIRRDEALDNLHSVYVDQWDWERMITEKERNQTYLKETVNIISDVVKKTADKVYTAFPAVKREIKNQVTFLTSQELEDLYPELSPKERENRITKEKGTVFLMQIGHALKSGVPHDDRAPDYDDWNLNGDLLYWYEPLGCAFEMTSMGIRVDRNALREQLEIAGCPERAALPFHQMLLEGKLPLTIGGGIGQSRLCMLLLGRAHVGEVQASIWPDEMVEACRENAIQLL